MNYALEEKKQFIAEMKKELQRLLPIVGDVKNVGSFFYAEVSKMDFNLHDVSHQVELENRESFTIFVNCKEFGGSSQLVGKAEYVQNAQTWFGGRRDFQLSWEADGYVPAEDIRTMLF